MKLHELTAHELSDRLATGEVSAVEVTEACWARINEVESRVEAFSS